MACYSDTSFPVTKFVHGLGKGPDGGPDGETIAEVCYPHELVVGQHVEILGGQVYYVRYIRHVINAHHKSARMQTRIVRVEVREPFGTNR